MTFKGSSPVFKRGVVPLLLLLLLLLALEWEWVLLFHRHQCDQG